MSLNEYVKYMTQQLTTFIDTPTDERKVQKSEKASVKERQTPFYSSKWLGILPFALKMFKRKRR